MNFTKFFRAAILRNTCEQLLLKQLLLKFIKLLNEIVFYYFLSAYQFFETHLLASISEDFQIFETTHPRAKCYDISVDPRCIIKFLSKFYNGTFCDEAHSEPCLTSKMECFVKIINGNSPSQMFDRVLYTPLKVVNDFQRLTLTMAQTATSCNTSGLFSSELTR